MNPCPDDGALQWQQNGGKNVEKKILKNATETSHISSSSGHFVLNDDKKFTVRVLKMKDSTLVFIGDYGAEKFDELSVAMTIRNRGPGIEGSEGSEQLISTTLLGTQIQSTSQTLAQKLCRRYKRQFFVSYNIQIDPLLEPLLNQKLAEYIRKNIEQFV